MAVKLGGAKDYSAMQGPCASGFHIPTKDDWGALYDVFTGLGLSSSANWQTYFKMPYAGYRNRSNASVASQGYWGYYWASSVYTNVANSADCLRFSSSQLYPGAYQERSVGESIRPFKDTSVIPDSSWTVLYQGTGTAGIYHNSTLGLITISSDGTTWITISDKNLGATTIYNAGDTLSETNCGKYYQRGNNYGFAWTGTLTTSSTQVDATNYGPGSYYSSSTFIIRSGTPFGWDSSNNKDLRGGVTGIRPGDLQAAYIGEVTSRLPSDYQEVEWIESTRTQRISTGYAANANMRMVLDFEITNAPGSDSQVVFGTDYGSWAWVAPLCFYYYGKGLQVGARNDTYFSGFTLNTPHTLDFSLTNVDLDGVTKTLNTTTQSNNITLFFGNGVGGYTRIYSCKIYTGSTLERELIPCYRKLDNVIGMYDLVNNTFYTNTGSGTFTKGGDV